MLLVIAHSLMEMEVAMVLNQENRELLFSDAADSWLENKRHELKESSFAKYKNILDRYLLPSFGTTNA